MKKIFTPFLTLLLAVTVNANAQEVVNFDFSKPDTFGIAVPDSGKVTNLGDADTLECGGIYFINQKNGFTKVFKTVTHYTQFVNDGENIDLMVQKKTVIKFDGNGKNIQCIEFIGSGLTCDRTFSKGYFLAVDDTHAFWYGDDSDFTMTNAAAAPEMHISKMIVTTGKAFDVRYPSFSSINDILYKGVTTPKTVTLSCETDSAVMYYRFEGQQEWTEYTEQGIQIDKSCTVWTKATAQGKESVAVPASYTVIPVTDVNSFSQFNALGDSTFAKVTVPLTVIHHWLTTYYSIIYATDGTNVFYINDRNCTIENQIAAGSVISAGVAGMKFNTGYMNSKPTLELIEGSLSLQDGEGTYAPVAATLSEINATPEQFRNKYIVLNDVTMTYVKTNNYTLSDGSESTLALFNRYSTLPSSLEDGSYNVFGFLMNNGTIDQFFPVAVEAGTGVIAPVQTDSSNVIYTIGGQRIDQIKSGLNIINGKKVFVE